MSRCVRGCREAGLSGDPVVGEGESEISPVSPRGKCRAGERIANPDQTGSLTQLWWNHYFYRIKSHADHQAEASRNHGTHSYIHMHYEMAQNCTRSRQVTDLSQALTHLHRYIDILSCSKEIAAWLALSLTLGANHLLCSYLQPPSCKITSTGTSRGRDMPESSRKNCRLPAIC